MALAATNIGTNSSDSGASSTVSVGSTLAVGSIVVILCGEYTSTATPGTVADSQGNSYSLISSGNPNNNTGYGIFSVYYAVLSKALVGGTDTITYTKHTSGNDAMTTAWVMTGAGILDTGVTASTYGSSSSPSVTGGAPVGTNDYILGLLGMAGSVSDSFTQDSTHAAYSTPPNRSNDAGSGLWLAGGGVLNTGSGALTYAPTTTSRPWIAFMIGFKPPTTTNLSATAGAYTLTGKASTLFWAFFLLASAGSYAITGGATVLNAFLQPTTTIRRIAAALTQIRGTPPTLSK